MNNRKIICKIISEMLDNPGECEIYPTGKCYDQLEVVMNKKDNKFIKLQREHDNLKKEYIKMYDLAEQMSIERGEALKETLAQAEIIGKDIDRCDKLVMEKRGLEIELERANGLLDEIEQWAWDNMELPKEFFQLTAILNKRPKEEE